MVYLPKYYKLYKKLKKEKIIVFKDAQGCYNYQREYNLENTYYANPSAYGSYSIFKGSRCVLSSLLFHPLIEDLVNNCNKEIIENYGNSNN